MAIFNNALYMVFTWIYENLTHNYILTVIFATLVLKFISLPADLKQRKESRKMAAIQPEIQKLQKRYGKDPQKLQQKQMELYRERKVNMYASCLPLLITMPIFIVFLGGLRLLANEVSVRIALEVANGNIAFLDQFRFLWINNVFQPDSGAASVVMSLKDFTALMSENGIRTLFMLSAETKAAAQALVPIYETAVMQPANAYALANAPAFLQNMVGSGALSNGWFILPAFSGLAAFLQNAFMTKANPQATAQPGMGKTMTYVLIGMSVFFCLSNNSIFAIYWTVNNLCSIALQLVLNKIYPPAAPEAAGAIEDRGTEK